MEEAEAVWEQMAPEVVPVQAQSGCWMSLQSETAQFETGGPRAGWEEPNENLKLVLKKTEATDFAHIWFLTLPFLWFLSWNRLPKDGWLRGLFLLAGQVTNPWATNRDCVAILQRRRVQLVRFFTICKGTGEERSEHKTLRKQEAEEIRLS